MARSVTFNGITRFTPGGITRVNAAALAQVTLGDNSIIGLIGEADGGAPGDEGGLVTFFDPSRAADVYKSGPIVDALNLAFQASNDPDVPGGASRVYVWKTNESLSSSVKLPNSDATVVIPIDGDLTSLPAADSGTVTTITGLVTDELNDAVFGRPNELVGRYVVIDPWATTTAIRQITASTVGPSPTITWVGDFVGGVTNEEYFILEDEVEVVDLVNGASTSTSIEATDATFVVDEHAGRWVFIQDGDGAGGPGESYLRQINAATDTPGDANTVDTLNFSPALPIASFNDGAYYQILANVIDLESKDWGQHTNGITVDVADTADGTKVVTVEFEGEEEVSPELGNRAILEVLYKGGALSQQNDTAAAGSTTTVINLTIGGLTPGQEENAQLEIAGEYTRIVANDATTITVSPALSEAPATGTALTIHRVLPFAKVEGSAGKATQLVTSFFGATATGDTFTFSTGQTLRELVTEINANPLYEASWGLGVNPDTTLVEDLDYGNETEFRTYVSLNLDVPEYAKRDVMDIVDYFNDFSTYVQASRSTDTGSSVSGLTAPAEIFEPVSLFGGARGITENSDFQAGFDELLKLRCNSVVPLIDQDLSNEGKGSTADVKSVAAQAAAHVAVARGAAQDTAGERGAFVGFRGTKTEIIEQANTLNDQDVQLVCQNPTTLDRTGTLVEFGPRMMAVIGASMRAGVTEVAEPLTHKLLRVSGITQDSSWDPSDVTDANEFIINGVLFAESIDGTGTRWVRDLTTWVADDNLAFSEGSVRDAVRFVAYGLRTTLVERFTGKKATPATIANVKDAASTYLELTRQDNIIVDSTDPATGEFVKAYHNLKVTSSGDTVSINVGIFPVPGINFQLTDIFLQLPTQSA